MDARMILLGPVLVADASAALTISFLNVSKKSLSNSVQSSMSQEMASMSSVGGEKKEYGTLL